MFLILTSDSSTVISKVLKCLDKKGWTFGGAKPIKGHRISIYDNYIFLYKDKTIHLGPASALDISVGIPIILVNDTPRDDIPFEYDKWIEGFKKEIEKSVLKGVYVYGKPSF